MRYLSLILLFLFPNIAVAQITQQQLLNTIASNLPTNNANEISALLLRNTLDLMTSAVFQGGPIPSGTVCPPVTGLTTFQFFANTTFAPTGTTINIFDGAQCAQFGTLNQTTHQFSIVTSDVTSTNVNVGNAGLAAGNWITTGSWDTIYQFPTVNALRVVSPSAGRSAGFYCRQSDIINPIVNCENLVIQTLIDQAPNPVGTAWNIYEETDVTATTAANVLNREIGFYSLIPNANALAASLPGTFNATGHTSAIRIGAGAGRTSAGSPNNISTAIEIIDNGSATETGILFGVGSLDVTGRVGQAIAMDDNMGFGWYTSISGGGGTGSSSLVAQIYEKEVSTTPFLNLNVATGGALQFMVNSVPIIGWNVTTFYPVTTNTITQGGSSNRFANIYSVNSNYSGTVTFPDGGTWTTTGQQNISNINLSSVNTIFWTSQTIISSPADGLLELTNNAATGFTRLQLGGTTSSFPSIKRNGTGLNFRLADDSGDSAITAGAANFSAAIVGPSLIVTSAAASTTGQTGFGNGTTAAGSGNCPTGTVGTKTVAGCFNISVGGNAQVVPYF